MENSTRTTCLTTRLLKNLGILEIPAGQPLFPTALYLHYSTMLYLMVSVDQSLRGLALNTSTWAAVADLTDDEAKIYRAQLRQFVERGIDLFARVG